MSLLTQPITPQMVAEVVKGQHSSLLPLLRTFQAPRYLLDPTRQRFRLAEAKLDNATSFREWLEAATELDKLEGSEAWKADAVSEDYNHGMVQLRLEQLKDAQLSCDVGRMLFLIRTAFARNIGDMGNINLYRHSRTGTKKLIEDYISACLNTIDRLLTTPHTPSSPSNGEILEALIQTRQAYGRTALLLSGGATFGMMHIGVIRALFETDLLPRIISGASAGSIVASVLCTKTDDEIPYCLETFAFGDLAVFDDEQNPDTILRRVARFLKVGAWIDIKHLVRVMRCLLGDMTFQEAYYRTRRVLNICVSSASIYELPRLLNYISSPNVIIWSAVAASCSVPFLFTPASILAKDPLTGEPVPWNPSPQLWIDGSVDNDLPITRLSEMFNVNHFIVSQVNPHVAPFMTKSDVQPPSSRSKSWGATLVSLATAEVVHRMSVVSELGILRTPLTKVRSILSQKYTGDITILPEIPYRDFDRMLKNPTPEFMLRASLCGESATWPHMSRIRNHCAVELALDKAIYMLRTRVVFSPSQTNLRLMLPGDFHTRGRRRRAKSSDGTYRPFSTTARSSFAESGQDRLFSVKKVPSCASFSRVAAFKVSGEDGGGVPKITSGPEQAVVMDDGGDNSDDVFVTQKVSPPRKIAMPPPPPGWIQNPFSLFMTPTPTTTPFSSTPASPELHKKSYFEELYGNNQSVRSNTNVGRRRSFDTGYVFGLGRAISPDSPDNYRL